MKRLWFLGALSTLALGCAAERYSYRPAEQSTATLAGRPAARYEIPPYAPRGDVRVSTYGVGEVEQEEGEKTPVLRVRLNISNDGDEAAWTLDTREVVVALPGHGTIGAAFVNAGSADLPFVSIPPWEQRTVDLYYPLPEEMAEASEIPAFDVLWRVRTARDFVAQRTPFERIAVEPSPASGAGAGPAPYWWYDPFFFGHPAGAPAVILRGPRQRLGPPPRRP